MKSSNSSSQPSLYDLLDVELPDSLKQETSNGQRIQLRDQLFVNVSVRERTDEGLAPAREYALRDLSAGGMSITSTDPMAVGCVLEVEGCINHRTWKGRLEVVHCTLADDHYKVGMKLLDRLDTPQPASRANRVAGLPQVAIPGRPSKEANAESCLAQVEIDLDQVRNAFLAAENTWEQLGRTVRRLILKAAGDLPEVARPEPETETNQRQHCRQTTNLDASMVVMGSENWRRLALHVTDVSEGGLGGEIPKERLDDESAAQDGGECVLHAGLPVMMAFGVEPDTIWLPAEIIHCDYGRSGHVSIGVQFITPMALQFFGA